MADLTPLVGRLVAAEPIVAVPDRFWEADRDGEVWSFRGWADLVVAVDETSGGGSLKVRFVPEGRTASMHFRASWDQQPLGEVTAAGEGGLEVEVPPDLVSAGMHRFRIERVKARDSEEIAGIDDCEFKVVEYGVDDARARLRPDRAGRYELIRAFLEDGVTGSSNRRWGGMLVEGRQSVKVRLTSPVDAEASFRVATLDGSTATFTVEAGGGGRSVTAGDTATEISLPVAAGTHDLRLSIDGDEGGLHLWGAPFLRHHRGRLEGPVVLITLDTTRRDVLSVYGGPEECSPNIARLAERATVFENAWSTSPWTLPSHASLFTGLVPTRHGAGVSNTRLDARVPTLAVLAREAGYRTAGFAGGALAASRWGLAQGFELYLDPDGFETPGDRQTELARSFIEDHAAEPFFLFVNYFDPHAMYRAPDAFESVFGVAALRARLAEVPVWRDVARGDAGAWRAVINGEIASTPEAVEYLTAAYRAEVAFMDHQIGRLMSTLEDHDLFDRATIILVADHGELLGEGGYFSHGCRLDPELTEVPLVVKWPRQTTPRRDVRLTSQVDLYPTILGALGISTIRSDGLPIGPEQPVAADERSTVFMEEHENRIHPLFEHMKIARHLYGFQELGRRQIVWDGGSACSERSRGGWRDAACRVSWQRRLEELATIAALPVGTDPLSADAGLTKEMREHLEALGYIR